MYKVKEIFYSLQGEGARAGRASVFCRFSKCNLWNGRESSRETSVCQFCDTDINGTDGQNGGQFQQASDLAAAIHQLWPEKGPGGVPYVVFTGGEPLLQLDASLTQEMHTLGYEVAIETNGTLPVPDGVDWICLSPKADAQIVLEQCDELKLVYPQQKAMPQRFADFPSRHYFLSPMADPLIRTGDDPDKRRNTQSALDFCLANPHWRLTLQLHKLLGID